MSSTSSFLPYPEESRNGGELQIWNNAAFDNGESEDSTAILKPSSSSSWWNQSLESSCSKENINPGFENSPVSLKSSVSSISTTNTATARPLHVNSIIPNTKGQGLSKRGMPTKHVVLQEDDKACDERKIDLEIEEIEKEISRLKNRLDALRLEKIEKSIKCVEKRGKVVPAKFMEPKPTVKVFEEKEKFNRRGVSLGPSEIFYTSNKSRLLNKQEMMATPVSTQNRRKSCFWKLEEIDELKATKERGKSQSVSPRSRKTSKIQPPKQAMTTVGAKRPIKKQEGLIQPKTLFKEGEKSGTIRKPVKPGRIVASRYNQISSNGGSLSEARKRSWPENDKEDGNKRRASKGNGLNSSTATKPKKKWEINPGEVVVYKSDESPPPGASVVADLLPKIRTSRGGAIDTPRDSGPAKRVADLVGRKSYFCIEEEGEEAAMDHPGSVCQALSFGEEDDV